jgi:hypothetical protein
MLSRHRQLSDELILTQDRDDFQSIGSVSSVTSGFRNRDDDSVLRFSASMCSQSAVSAPGVIEGETTESIYSGKAESDA